MTIDKADDRIKTKQAPPKSVRMPNDTQKLLQILAKLEGVTLGDLLQKLGEAYAQKTHPEILQAIRKQKIWYLFQ